MWTEELTCPCGAAIRTANKLGLSVGERTAFQEEHRGCVDLSGTHAASRQLQERAMQLREMARESHKHHYKVKADRQRAAADELSHASEMIHFRSWPRTPLAGIVSDRDNTPDPAKMMAALLGVRRIFDLGLVESVDVSREVLDLINDALPST